MGIRVDTPITTGTLLASAARTATVHSAFINLVNRGRSGVRVFINTTAVPGSAPSTVFSIEQRDPLDHTVYTSILDSAAVTATGTAVMHVYPGAGEVANKRVGAHIGTGFRVTATHGNANSVTYTVSYEELP